MKVSKKFLADFAYLANYYGWDEEDIEEVKAVTRTDERMKEYWSSLADSHKAGYKQTKENGFMRLEEWMATNENNHKIVVQDDAPKRD